MRYGIGQQGFTLMQTLVAVLVLGVLATMAMAMYQHHVKQARVRAMQAALLENAQFLERFYGQQRSFKQNANEWVALPITQTEHFCIRLQGQPRNAQADRFMLKAVAWDKTAEPRIFRLNQDLNFFVCQHANNTCADADDFFANPAGNEQDCSPFK